MKLSEEIREYIIRHHIERARRNGQARLTLRAGDIHEELGYSGRVPAVCSVLGSNRLQHEARIRRLRHVGPHNGLNAEFSYDLQ
jgi:5-methylcytosine-specific restriction protein B